MSSATPSTISPPSALLVHIDHPSTPPPVFAVSSFISWPEQQFHGKQHESILLEFRFLFVARDPDCPQGSLLPPQPPKPCRLIKISSQFVGISQIRTARFGILGSPPCCIACIGHALSRRPESGGRQVHTRNENHGLFPPTLHPSNRRVSRKLLVLSNPSHTLLTYTAMMLAICLSLGSSRKGTANLSAPSHGPSTKPFGSQCANLAHTTSTVFGRSPRT